MKYNRTFYQKKIFFLALAACFLCLITSAHLIRRDTIYHQAYDSIEKLLVSPDKSSFKTAVFITENAFHDNQLSFNNFDSRIQALMRLMKAWQKRNRLFKYSYPDRLEVLKSYSVYAILKDTTKIEVGKDTFCTIDPYSYDMDDFLGKDDWTKTFVTKLLSTNSGNCHSLPYLYKILSDEMGITNAWLSFAPNHIYVKNHCEGVGWYNTELTSGQFPIDAWIMTSGYVPFDAVKSGIYMDTISNQQAIANCALDLAKGYERKYKIYTDSFIIRCCDLTLKYHPTNINAIIYKAEILKKIYQIYKKEDNPVAANIYVEMEKIYLAAMDLGYKEIPEKTYLNWLKTLNNTTKNRYTGNRINGRSSFPPVGGQ